MRLRDILHASILASLLTAGCGGGEEPAETTTAEPVPTETAGDETADTGAAPTLALPNQRQPAEGLTTGGQPTGDDLRAAAANGYTLVISLRTESEPGMAEERALAEELGMRWENVPVAGAEGVTAENAARVDALIESAEGPVLLHCGSGNRAGAMVALRAFEDGADIEGAIEAGRAAGLTGLEDAVRERLGEMCEADPDRTC